MQIKYTIIFSFAALAFCQLNAQEIWEVPADQATKLSPFEFSAESQKAGSEIYTINCASCHGIPGKANAVALVPPPGDPAAKKFQANTDGAMYYKIREGRGAMPSFKNTLTPDQIWNVISYLRTYNKSYVQQVAKEIQRGAYEGDIELTLSHLAEKGLIEARLVGIKDSIRESIGGAAIQMIAVRMFGNLPLEEEKITNEMGLAYFKVPEKMPADTQGNLNLIARLSDQEAFGQIESKIAIQTGKPTTAPSLRAERAMWNTMAMAPLWLLFTYAIGVLAAWGTIFYILLQLKKIFFLGK
ncbi:MAG: cytochrome c [Bacteroidota bacterium]|nr:MAG: cytochrome c [Bacteroidota bacterium]